MESKNGNSMPLGQTHPNIVYIVPKELEMMWRVIGGKGKGRESRGRG